MINFSKRLQGEWQIDGMSAKVYLGFLAPVNLLNSTDDQ